MKRRFHLILVISLLLCSMAIPVCASDGLLVIDYADLLTQQQESTLLTHSKELERSLGLSAVVLTVDSLEGKDVQTYADDFYDSIFPEDGLILLIAMEEREWCISTCGEAIRLLDDWDLYELEEAILPYLSQGDYYGAFQEYYYCVEYYSGQEPSAGEPRGLSSILLVSAGIGLLVAVVTILIMRSGMNTKRPQRSAEDYLGADGFHLRTRQDFFLYSQVRKTRRQQNTGSTTHRSSSGRSHGGRSGRF